MSSFSSSRVLRALLFRFGKSGGGNANPSSSSSFGVGVGVVGATTATAALLMSYSDDDAVHAVKRVATASKHLVPVYFVDYRRHLARVKKIEGECTNQFETDEDEKLDELKRESRQTLWTDVAVRLRDLARENGGIYT